MEAQLGVDQKTAAQLRQIDETNLAAKILRDAGFKCEVREFFTGSATKADAAGIFIEMR